MGDLVLTSHMDFKSLTLPVRFVIPLPSSLAGPAALTPLALWYISAPMPVSPTKIGGELLMVGMGPVLLLLAADWAFL